MQATNEDDELIPAVEPYGRRSRYVEPSPSIFRSTRVPLLAGAYTVGLLLYLAVEPTPSWMLLVLTGAVAIGTDGILRGHPGAALEDDKAWTAPLLFLPTLMVLASGLFLEDVADGYWVVPAAIASAAMMTAVLYADYISIDGESPSYPGARFVLNIGTYLTGFAFYAVVYSFDVSLLPAAVSIGLVSLLLSVEVLREAEADPARALVYGGVVGLIVAEARWALYFLPLESYLAGVFLLLVLYMVSGLVQHHLNNDLSPPVVSEFVAIALIGVLIVTLGRIFESGG